MTRRTLRVPKFVVLAALAAATIASFDIVVAHAQTRPPDEELAEIREALLHAEYRPALRRAIAYLERTDLSASDRNAGLEVLAIIHIALRDDDAAQAVLHELFERDPGHRMSDTDAGPMVRSAFVRAREMAHPVAVRLEAERCSFDDTADTWTAEARVTEAVSAVATVRAMARHQGDVEWATAELELAPDGEIRVRVRASPGDERLVEYHLSALSPSGATLGQLGSPESPIVCNPEEETAPPDALVVDPDLSPPSGPVDQGAQMEWWPWLVAGIVAVGAGVGIAAGVVVAEESARPSLGEIALPLVRF
ncbi:MULTISPECIES: hypothetical protein [Sandaracinus]|uniref:hypothetical protein n=1 Tax=Sandaracinus TaxID=1055688 RepID=UPI0019D49B76|nr:MULTISPECIES: hypothetical protein [Sandaracinus]QRN75808.1 Hypothetical protein MSR10575_88950 [Sandaracinus sp.]UJR87334.1 Hypothetical protein I5071_1260 [Sandaracinus amylolyticus]